MKICAIICEYNPFHNGHAYHIAEAKRLSGADTVLCLMSGNFVQRGEAAILEKRIRARHALLLGADAVIELPTVFACSNAEIFASGAVKLLSAIPSVTHLCFGAEHAEKEQFEKLAELLSEETEEFSAAVKAFTKQGMSYPKAYEQACAQVFGESVCTPNDILGVEYAKAAKRFGAKFQLLPIKRQGNGYLDESLQGEFLSATAIRKSVEKGVITELSPYLPQCVLNDLQRSENRLSVMERAAILTKTPSDLKAILDCTEGLENAFLKAAATSDDFVETLTCSRYTSARIRRIALHCLLGIREDFIRECLTMPLYLAPLAYKKEATDLLKALDEATIPFLSSGKRIKALTGTGRRCFETDEFAETMYAAVKNIATAKNSPFLL